LSKAQFLTGTLVLGRDMIDRRHVWRGAIHS